MATPYRTAEVRTESTPLRRSWWDLAMSVLVVAYTAALAYVLMRYAAEGWIGYAVSALVALLAVAFAREIGAGRYGDCPQCGTRLEIGSTGPHGYQCASCKTFLDIDRGQLIRTPSDRVTKLARFRVEYDDALVLPDLCCVCLAPPTRRVPTKLRSDVVDVPYCADHERGLSIDPNRRAVGFRSFAYATRVCEASHGRLVGVNVRAVERGDSRWLGFGLAVLFGVAAAGAHWGLAALERAGYVIVPGSLKGVVVWLCLKALGRHWVVAILTTVGVGFFAMFLGSFNPHRRLR